MGKQLFVITSKSLTTGGIIYFRNVRGNKCRWTDDPNKAFAFATPQSAAYHIRLRQLKYVHIQPIERETKVLKQPMIKKAMQPLARLMDKWS